MSTHFCLALLALCSLTAASDPECADLLQPLEERSQVFGKWIFHVGTSDNGNFLQGPRDFNSSQLEISPIPETNDVTMRWADRVNGQCYQGEVVATLSGEHPKQTFKAVIHNNTFMGTHLKTCADCLLWSDSASTTVNGETIQGRHLFLFTKSGNLADADLEVFKKQAACHNFPSELRFGGATEMCTVDKEAAAEVMEAEH